MAVHQLTCVGCGAQFTSRQSKAIYCGAECRAEAARQRKRSERRLRKRIMALTYECWWCGKDYHPKRAEFNKACSRECGFKVKDFLRSARTTRLVVSVVVSRLRCLECDKPFTSRNGAKCCSDECRSQYARRRSLEANKAKHDCCARDCKECGADFVPEYGSKRRKFCSEICARRSHKRTARKRQRARLKAAHVEAVNPTNVFQRDGWRCQHCKRKTPRKLRGSYDDRAPELDHIVPLAQGGEHSYRNTQCLCRACNAAKADGAGGQLRLFG